MTFSKFDFLTIKRCQLCDVNGVDKMLPLTNVTKMFHGNLSTEIQKSVSVDIPLTRSVDAQIFVYQFIILFVNGVNGKIYENIKYRKYSTVYARAREQVFGKNFRFR